MTITLTYRVLDKMKYPLYLKNRNFEIHIADCLEPTAKDFVIVTLFADDDPTGLIEHETAKGTIKYKLKSEGTAEPYAEIEYRGQKQVLAIIDYLLECEKEQHVISNLHVPLTLYKISLRQFPDVFIPGVVIVIARAKIEKVIDMILAHSFAPNVSEKLRKEYQRKPVSKPIKSIFDALIAHRDQPQITHAAFIALYKTLITMFNEKIPTEAMALRNADPNPKKKSFTMFTRVDKPEQQNTVDLYINILRTLEESGLVIPSSEKIKGALLTQTPLPEPVVELVRSYISG